VISRTLLFRASVRHWLMPSRVAWRMPSRWRRIVLARRMNNPKAAAQRLTDEPVDQDRDVLEREAGFEDRPERLLERVRAAHLAAGGSPPPELTVLLVVEAVGCFEQRPAGVLDRRAASGSSSSRSLFQ